MEFRGPARCRSRTAWPGTWLEWVRGGLALAAGSEKAAAHRLGLAHARSKVGATTTAQLVWILAPRVCPMRMVKRRGWNIRYRAAHEPLDQRRTLTRSELTVRMRCFKAQGPVRPREVR